MTQLPAPRAKRLQRPSWRDSRLVVGVLLVLLSATLGAKAVASADDRTAHFVAARNLVAGDPISPADLRRVDVRLDATASGYLRADRPAPPGRFAVRDVREGELVPVSAIGTAAEVGVQRLTVRVDAVSATGLTQGTSVDVFLSEKPPGVASTERRRATKALSSVGVAAVLPGSSGLGSNATTSVQLYVPSEKVQTLVEAVDADAKVTLVPVAGAASTPAS
ncbi:MAG TPA: SAF domain-containing protein [Intrasporangium sp.]|uniref:SAF domain-containing protein n=1 Tax=Intrasporangium sp. TaxID=1925024 RepID=UPI002D78F75E|nr:SAF domain-containing protein [Intrasporangium sp.]HET7400000.1 SAF domain-containing protein [Intrasporangium sp.]